jgi:hypothetical protein
MSDELATLRAYLERLQPDMPAAELERRLQALVSAPADRAYYKLHPETHRGEVAPPTS